MASAVFAWSGIPWIAGGYKRDSGRLPGRFYFFFVAYYPRFSSARSARSPDADIPGVVSRPPMRAEFRALVLETNPGQLHKLSS